MAQRRRDSFCGSPVHALDRRRFLGTMAASAAAFAADMSALDMLTEPVLAGELKKQGKRVILLWLAGASQLETFDPKPGAATGGPFRAIPTSVPGVHISELMPKMARRMKDTCIVRSLNTKIGDHVTGARLMTRGRPDDPSLRHPDMGAVIARELGRLQSAVPDYVSFYSATEGRDFAPGSGGFLGSRYSPIELTTALIPENLRRPEAINELDHRQRGELRELMSRRFARGRAAGAGALGAHNEAYQRVRGLMASESLFDVAREPQAVRDAFGPSQFGEQALVARRLVEAGVPFVRVGRAWWDSHGQNFETHQELVPELDHVMSALLDDLEARGLLESTLVVTLAEFGRTPTINGSLGRDHFATAWSATLSGCGIRGGSVHGKTDAKGQAVIDGEVGAPELFATIYRALGIDHQKNYYVSSRPVPLTEPGTEPIEDVLA